MESSIKTLTITGGAAQVKAPRRPASKQTTRRRPQFENENEVGQERDYEDANGNANAHLQESMISQPLKPIITSPGHETLRVQMPRVQVPRVQIPKVEIPKVEIPRAHMPHAKLDVNTNINAQTKSQINLLPVKQLNRQVNQEVQEHKEEPSKITKVILNPAKPRVKLNPPKSTSVVAAKSQTRKARRIHLTTSSLTHRFTRAKKLTDEAEQKPVENIREYLIKRGVIQEKSKAPVKMLKSMYNDLNLLKDGQAL
jgi:hypothetical protein